MTAAWTQEQQEIIALLREDAQADVAPPARAWRAPRRPDRNRVEKVFGSWSAAVAAAGLLTRREAIERARVNTEEEAEAARVARAVAKSSRGAMRQQEARLRRQAALKQSLEARVTERVQAFRGASA